MTLITPQLKAIDTKFDGNLYRSRLEARWAVFMKRLRINFMYEHEGYDLGDGVWYLPDFWLPTFNGGCFVEVKPIAFTEIEIEKVKRLVAASNMPCILAVGLPDFKCQEIVFYDVCNGIENFDISYGLMNADSAFYEDRMYMCPPYANRDLTINEGYWQSHLGLEYIWAVSDAKEARF